MVVMKRTLRIAGGLVLLLGAAVGGVLIAARFHDGPLEIVAGGPFTSGERHTGPDYSTVEFQLLDPPRSRTTWIMEHDGRIFIVSGYMNTLIGRFWKHWPMEAVRDGRAILRVDGKLYDRQMVRIREGEVVAPVLAEVGRKYFGGAAVSPDEIASGNIWLFELRPRG
jgi:hypothetical protein